MAAGEARDRQIHMEFAPRMAIQATQPGLFANRHRDLSNAIHA